MSDSELEGIADRAEALDALFDSVTKDLPRCAMHPQCVVYLDGGCSQCRAVKDAERRKRRYARKLCRRRNHAAPK
jgi:hypothetical protein